MSSPQQPTDPHETPPPNLYSSFIASSFTPFRLVFIPAFTLTHAAHGPLWGSLVLALALTFGGEWLARQRTTHIHNWRRDLLVVAASLFLIGLFPEETPVQLILWAGIGLAWGNYSRSVQVSRSSRVQWLAYIIGTTVGLAGLIGPGSWIMALLIGWQMVRTMRRFLIA